MRGFFITGCVLQKLGNAGQMQRERLVRRAHFGAVNRRDRFGAVRIAADAVNGVRRKNDGATAVDDGSNLFADARTRLFACVDYL